MECMEISKLSSQTLKIRGKKTALLIDPVKETPKTACDGVIVLSAQEIDMSRSEGARVFIKGAGEYEVGGIKISAQMFGAELVYGFIIDGIRLLVATSQGLKNAKDLKEYHVLLVNARDAIDSSLVTSVAPRLLVLYGENAEKVAQSIGKEAQTMSRYSVTSDKLPEEMQVVILA